MNSIDVILARIPLSEVTIRTTINSYSVIERIEYWAKAGRVRSQGKRWFTFDGSYRGNYFKIQGHLTNYDGQDQFPADETFPIKLETSPAFYGRVFDEGEGSVIKGHFGFPFPGLIALVVLCLLAVGRIYPQLRILSLAVAVVFAAWAIFSLVEFITERKGVLEFLKGLFSNVSRTE